MQRFMTNSDFDHVGMALKYRKAIPNDPQGHSVVKLYILEATGANVSLILFILDRVLTYSHGINSSQIISILCTKN